MSLGALGSVLSGLERQEEAAERFAEGLRLMAPLFAKLPQAFAGLTVQLAQVYFSACQQAEIEPDAELLGPILEKLQELQSEEN